MAQRKLLQEVEKCFKKVAEGVAEFESIYEKIEQSTNPAQKDKLEDNLKREIKKLQRLRDQIKTWAASNDIKDKGPLLEQRRLIETQMEKFKAVEKAMKTKAYSKEGLSAAAKLDPKEKAKVEASDFLSQMVDDLEQQIETLEAESEQIQATMKKGKGQAAKAERVSNIEAAIERHKWHQSRLELMRRSLENGRLEPAQIRDLDEGIRYYVSENANDDFMEDDGLYDELGLDEDEEAYGLAQDKDNVSSQDTQSIQEDAFEPENGVSKAKPRTGAESAARRPSAQLKSPLPTLATLAAPLPTISSNSTATTNMKPATIPARPAEGLKYASAAAAAAASDKIGIAPLPPPPGAAPASASGISPLTQVASAVQARSSSASSPIPVSPQPATVSPHLSETLPATSQLTAPPSHHKFNLGVGYSAVSSAAPPTLTSQAFPSKSSRGKAPAPPEPLDPVRLSKPNGLSNGFTAAEKERDEDGSIESIYHLPESLRDLVGGYEMSAKRQVSPLSQASLRMLARSQEAVPESSELEPRSTYHPEVRYVTLSNFPTEPLAILDSPSLYGRIDPDTLFYVFYYKQGTYQQYLAAKALKDQSWRFHKQYQTWFQRHEEPKAITEEFEQGTYRFFDYESTWMNRRKADFKFHYKYLEDDV